MSKNRIDKLKRRKIIQRFRSRKTAEASVDRKAQDVQLIDLVLAKLYNDGDKQTASMNDDVLKPNKIEFTDAGSDRLWDILLSTGLVQPVIGFGRAGRLSLTNDGYQLMTRFGSYKNFIEQREQQSKIAAQQSAPRFILSANVNPVKEEEKEESEQPLKQDEKAAFITNK